MATEEETKAKMKTWFNEVLDERQAAADAKRKQEEEEAAKNQPPKKGFLDSLLGG